MKEKLRKFLRPRLAVLLAAALLAASLPAGILPSAYAANGPTETWEDKVSGDFTAAGTALDSYTYYGSDGREETVIVDHEADLGSKENPISIPDEESLIRFGKLESTEDNYYILDKENGIYDMQGGTRSMLPLMGACESDGTSNMPSPERWFAGVLIGNGAEIQNACIKAPEGNRTHPGLFGCLKNAEIMDLTVSLTFAEQNNSLCYAGGIAAAASGDNSLQRLTVDLTVAENSSYRYAGGLLGYMEEEYENEYDEISPQTKTVLNGCTARIHGSLQGRSFAAGLVGMTNANVVLTGCDAQVTGDLEGTIVGGLVGAAYRVDADGCDAEVTGALNGGYVGGLVGVAPCMALTGCTAQVTGDLEGMLAGGLVGNGSNMTLTNCTATVTGSLAAADESSAVGGLVGSGSGMTLTNCTATVMGNLTAADEGSTAGGLVGGGSGMTLTGCTAQVGGSLTTGISGISGGLVGTAVNRGGVTMGALQEEDAAGEPAQSGSAAMNLTNCSVKVDGGLTAGDSGVSGGLVGIAIDYSSTPMGALQEEDAAGDLARNGSDVTMSLVNCSVKVDNGLIAGAPGAVGGLVGVAGNSTITLTDCSAQVTGGLTAAAHEDGAAGNLVGIADSGAVTLTDCSVQTVITEGSPSGPAGMGAEWVAFTGTNVTTLQMGADSHVSLALVNGTTLELTDADGLTATGEAEGSETTGSVTVKHDGSAEIQVHGGDAIYTLTGVSGTIRLEDKTGDTPAEYWVTLDAGFTTADPDPLTRGDAVNLLGEADNRTHTVTVEAGAGGTVSGGGMVARNRETTVTATPDSGYRFVGWTENGRQVSADASYTFTVTSSRTLTAAFELIPPTYTVTVQAEGHGTASAAPGAAEAGTEITLTAEADSGWHFQKWEVVSGGVTIRDNRFDMPEENVTVKAVFARNVYTVTVQDSHAAQSGAGSYEAGAEVSVHAGSRSGYRFNGWTSPDGITFANAQSADTTFTMPDKAVAVTANWTAAGSSSGGGGSGSLTTTYKPEVSQPGGGGGTPSVSPANPKQGDTVTVTPKPEEGFEADQITVTDKNGKPLEVTKKPDGTYTFRQPNGKVKIEVTYRPIDRPQNNPFTDVSEGDWYYEAVRFVQEQGLMNGYSDGRFGPDDTLSRAQLAQILFNKEGRPAGSGQSDFTDVTGGAWYAEAVCWATGQGIVGGYGDGMFGPNDPITREQLAVMLWRYSGSPAAADRELHFNDGSAIGPFALEAMRWAVDSGILSGYGDGQLGPQGQATRAQVAQMLKNFMENQEKNT